MSAIQVIKRCVTLNHQSMQDIKEWLDYTQYTRSYHYTIKTPARENNSCNTTKYYACGHALKFTKCHNLT